MSDSVLQNPGVKLWEEILKRLLAYHHAANVTENAATSVGKAMSSMVGQLPDNITRAQGALIELDTLLHQSVKDPRRLGPHQALLNRLRAVFSADRLAMKWIDYKARVISADMIGSLGLFDADLAGPAVSPTAFAAIANDIKALQSKVAKADISPHWSALLVAQFDLIERSMARVNADGFANFKEVVFSTVGRLELELRVDKNEADAEVVREVIDDLLRVGGLIQFGSEAIKAIPFLTKIAGLLPAP